MYQYARGVTDTLRTTLDPPMYSYTLISGASLCYYGQPWDHMKYPDKTGVLINFKRLFSTHLYAAGTADTVLIPEVSLIRRSVI